MGMEQRGKLCCKMNEQKLTRSDKILLAIFELEKNRKPGEKITKENMVVKVWQLFPADFCLKGYPKYPNADITKYITALYKANLLKGSAYNFFITEKGVTHIRNLNMNRIARTKSAISGSRQIESEIIRIKNSKVFRLFLSNNNEFIESDLFEFLGTNARSLTSANKTIFVSKYNAVVEAIAFCEKIKSTDSDAAKIIALWKILLQKFGHVIEKNTNITARI